MKSTISPEVQSFVTPTLRSVLSKLESTVYYAVIRPSPQDVMFLLYRSHTEGKGVLCGRRNNVVAFLALIKKVANVTTNTLDEETNRLLEKMAESKKRAKQYRLPYASDEES